MTQREVADQRSFFAVASPATVVLQKRFKANLEMRRWVNRRLHYSMDPQ